MTAQNENCAALLDDLAAIVDGDAAALERHLDHLAECDACRDARHAAAETAARAKRAGADFIVPADIEARLLSAIDAEATAADGTAIQNGAASPTETAAKAIQIGTPAVPPQEAPSAPASQAPSTPASQAPSAPASQAPSAPASQAPSAPASRAPSAPAVAAAPMTDIESAAAARRSKTSRSGATSLAWVWAAAAVVVLGLSIPLARLVSRPSGSGSGGTGPVVVKAGAGTTGRVARVVRAAEGTGGVEIQAKGTSVFLAASEGAAIEAGATVRTDERTRARIELADGTVIALDHGTELLLDASGPRVLSLRAGEIVADVAHVEGAPPAEFMTKTGRVEVLGTRFVLSAADDPASVLVARGRVRIHGAAGDSADVRAGETGLLPSKGAVSVSPATDIARQVAWSEFDGDKGEPQITGMGELRAKKPGEDESRERPLSLALHRVSVRIAGNVARTEIEERFQNDGGDTLEGIFRFPLPAGARIERLALEVDGRMEEGAFVERERAAKIWRGVIRQATPQAQRKQEEFVWVPGPWRDPALLEWQQGGRFELRIYPIPARGSRRVILAYTENVSPRGAARRYAYPLAHSSDASTRIGRFEFDARIAGADGQTRVAARNYAAAVTREAGATRLAFTQDRFLPAGDLIIDYAAPDSGAQLKWWTFRAQPAGLGGGAGAGGGVGGGVADNSDGAEAWFPWSKRTAPAPGVNKSPLPPGRVGVGRPPGLAAIAEPPAGPDPRLDGRSYVAFALRPKLPVRAGRHERDYAILVDASQSMVGERYARASRLASEIVRQMDEHDRFTVLACDATCRELSGGLRAPSEQAASDVRAFLSSLRPAGASDVALALRRGSQALRGEPDRDRHAIYLGDGLSTVGHRLPSLLAGEAEALRRATAVSFNTVGIGGDADSLALAAIARAGGGHHLPYVPGERAALAALTILETTWGVLLRDVQLELPAGVTDVAPAKLSALRAGEEVLVTARFDGEPKGEVVLRGTAGGQPFEGRWPVSLAPSTAGGNAFVARLWAERTISQLELDGGAPNVDTRARIVALSQSYAVMSRHTSLLVLESEAMSRAFGVNKTQAIAPLALGDDVDENEAAEPDAEAPADKAEEMAEKKDGAGIGSLLGKKARRAASSGGDLDELAQAAPSRDDVMAAPPASRPAPAAKGVGASGSVTKAPAGPWTPFGRPILPPPAEPPGRGGRWMRKVWFRVGSVEAGGAVRASERRAIETAERALEEAGDSRDRHRALVRALSRAGELSRAVEIAEGWLSRDRLDPEALTALADLFGRKGERDEALRLLSGVVDLRPDDRVLQERLARAFERSGDEERACAHRLALAEATLAGGSGKAAGDAAALGAALRCERALGRDDSAGRLLALVSDAALKLRVEQAGSVPPEVPVARGELLVEGTWDAPVELDLALITPDGTRLSWMGGRTSVSADAVSAIGRERLGVGRASTGSYLVEVNRTRPGDDTAVRGRLRVRVLGVERELPFSLDGERAVAGRVIVERQFRME